MPSACQTAYAVAPIGATAPFDTLLGVKYVIVDGDYAIPDTYIHIYDGKETGVYENPDALSIAYAVNGALKDFHLAYPSDYKDGLADGKYEKFTAPYTPPERMNRMTAAMLGEDGRMERLVALFRGDRNLRRGVSLRRRV